MNKLNTNILIIIILLLYNTNSYSQKTKLQIDDKAPFFELYNQYGRVFNSLDYINKKRIVICFYPKDESKLCTKQFCFIRDNMSDFKKLNAIIVGINSESIVNHKNFMLKNKIPIPLLFDRNNEVQKMFGVPNHFNSKKPKRYTFIINKKGTIIDIIYSKNDIENNMARTLEVLKKNKE